MAGEKKLRKIRLTLLWTDEATMNKDFRNKVSEKMIEWGNAFYERYGLVIDAQPQLRRPLSLAHKFLLRKSDGIRPDPGFDQEEHDNQRKEEEAPYQEELKELENEKARLKAEMVAHEAEDDRIDARIKSLDVQYEAETDRDVRHAIHEQIRALYKQASLIHSMEMAILKRVAAIGIEKDEVNKKIKEVVNKYEKIREDAKAEIPLRIALGLKFQDEIVTTDRLPVVFCDFVSHGLAMRKPRRGRTLAQTFLAASYITDGQYFLWPKPFIMIDVNSPVSSTLAHEIVHAPGRAHPDSKKVRKALTEYFGIRPARVEGSFINQIVTIYQNQLRFAALFREVPGGFFDGPFNSILNYNSARFSPDEVVLTDYDKRVLEWAYFVKTAKEAHEASHLNLSP